MERLEQVEADGLEVDSARFRAFHYGVVLLLYGRSQGDEALVRVGQDALRYSATG